MVAANISVTDTFCALIFPENTFLNGTLVIKTFVFEMKNVSDVDYEKKHFESGFGW